MLALIVLVHFEDLVEFFYNSTVLCIVKFTGHLLCDEILLAVREWERERMGITNGNGKGIALKKTFTLISTLVPCK